MARLVAKTPAEGLVPVSVEGAVLTEVTPEAITWVAPFKGAAASVDKALKAAGLGMPEPNRTLSGPGGRAIWTGPGQAMILGPRVAPEGAAHADQSDAFCCLALEGPAARDILARLTPMDLRPGQFEVGHTARTLLFHMTASITRTAEDRYEIMVFRSMARTAVHDLARAMEGVAAQTRRA